MCFCVFFMGFLRVFFFCFFWVTFFRGSMLRLPPLDKRCMWLHETPLICSPPAVSAIPPSLTHPAVTLLMPSHAGTQEASWPSPTSTKLRCRTQAPKWMWIPGECQRYLSEKSPTHKLQPLLGPSRPTANFFCNPSWNPNFSILWKMQPFWTPVVCLWSIECFFLRWWWDRSGMHFLPKKYATSNLHGIFCSLILWNPKFKHRGAEIWGSRLL